MSIKSFNTITSLVILILLILIFIFAALNFTSKPQVRSIRLTGEQTAAELRNQRLQVRFNRPIAKHIKENTVEFISLSPAVKFKTNWLGNDLFIIFSEPLQASSDYQITFSAAIEDSYGDKFAEDYIYKFTTRTQKLYYIERNYPDSDDRIIETDANLTSRTQIYSGADEIINFSKKGEYLAVIERQANSSKQLKIINLEEDKIKIPLGDKKDVFVAKFSERSDNLYILSQDFSLEDGYIVPEAGRKLWVYNLNNSKLRELSIGNNFTDIDEFFLSPDERALVIKDAVTLFYYLIDLNNPETSVSLGKYLSTGGFNQKGDRLIFSSIDLAQELSHPYIISLDAERNPSVFTDGVNYAVDPVYIPDLSNGFVYATKYRDVADTKGLSQLVIADHNGKVLREVRQEDLGLEIPRPSVDGRFIALEAYDVPALMDYQNQRSLSFQAKPYTAKILVYDRVEEKLVDNNFKGIEAYWE